MFPDRDYLLTSKRYFAGKRSAIAVSDAVPWDTLISDEFEEPLAGVAVRIQPRVLPYADRSRHRRDHRAYQGGEQGLGLSIAAGRPFTRLNETHFSAAGEPVASSIIDVDNEFVTFEVFRRE